MVFDSSTFPEHDRKDKASTRLTVSQSAGVGVGWWDWGLGVGGTGGLRYFSMLWWVPLVYLGDVRRRVV